jgi:hypothetical protein
MNRIPQRSVLHALSSIRIDSQIHSNVSFAMCDLHGGLVEHTTTFFLLMYLLFVVNRPAILEYLEDLARDECNECIDNDLICCEHAAIALGGYLLG